MKFIVSKSSSSASLDAVAFFIAKAHLKDELSAIAKLTGNSLEGLKSDFHAKEGEVSVIYNNETSLKSPRVFLLGLGEKVTLDALRASSQSFARRLRELKLAKVALDFSKAQQFASDSSESVSYLAQAITEGFIFGAYDYTLKTDNVDALKGKKSTAPKFDFKDVTLLCDDASMQQAKEGVSVGEIIGSSQSMVRDLINAPSNYLSATDLANAAKSSGKKYGYTVTVFDKKKIHALKMGGLIGVNQGSTEPPTFSILEYKPKNAKKTIAIVGKGVTFDTGGISIKPADNMGDMKSDMSGAADVIGAVEVAARLKLPVHVVGIIPATDNKPSGSAQNPGDVLTTYAGITVEVDNTDAEGRLILADALTYAKEQFQPDTIIDLATLTGACVIALGYQAAGMFTNNDALAERLSKAGFRSGEKVWRMPLWEEYDKQIKSDIADVKNTGGRGAGAVTAAKFLEKFIGDHPSWAHLDIAGPSFPSMGSSGSRGSSGFGVRLLAEALRQWN
ncbi:MAG: leucyl aminopeptidase [Chloroherpetonaceae bacterium]|nr:leucyl aminopeptidase [Chloroherpetonaceae bacterium]